MNRNAGRQGGIALVLVLVAVLVLSLLGLAGSAGASSFASGSEMLVGDRTAASLARQALDEAQEILEAEAAEAGSAWGDALRRGRIEGTNFQRFQRDLVLARTPAQAAVEVAGDTRFSASATLFQQNPYGVRALDRTWGGDQTFGTVALEVTVELEAPGANLFSRGRSVTSRRLAGFRAVSPKVPAPFDQSPLWVRDPGFLRAEASELRRQLLSVFPAIASAALARIDDYLKDMFYARIGLERLSTGDLTCNLAGAAGPAAQQVLQQYRTSFDDKFRFIRDSATRTNMTDYYWPQLDDEYFSGRRLGRADHIFRTQRELEAYLRLEPGKPVRLDGICYVQGPVQIDWSYTGHGAIVSPRTIRVVRARRAEADSTLTLISTRGDLDLADSAQTIEAALVASTGTVQGLTGKTIRGLVVAWRLSTGFERGSDTRIEFDKLHTHHEAGRMAADPDTLDLNFDAVPLAQF
jgi:hypothetical protein